MQKYGLIIFIALIMFFSANSAADAAFSFYIGGQKVELAASQVVNGNILIPASVLRDYMAADVESDLEAGKLSISFPTHTIIMEIGSPTAKVNGEEQIMDVAPQAVDGEFMIPLRFVVDLLGLQLSFDAKQAVLYINLSDELADWVRARAEGEPADLNLPEFLNPEQSTTIGTPVLKKIVFMGGPRSRVFIDLDGFAAYESFLLTNPDRMVIDLTGVCWDGPFPEQVINDTLVRRIRSDQFDHRTIRIVFDLNRATDYEINRWPDGGLEIEFNYQIRDIGYYRDEEQNPRIWFEANEQPMFSVQMLPSPMRLVLDFQSTTLLDGARELQVGDPPLRSVRISQNTPSITRMVLDLDGPMIPIEVEEINGRYEIILFEGTEQEYQAKLEREAPKPVEPELLIPEDRKIDDSLPLAHRILVVDPGHGGSDPGTIGNVLGVFEKDVVLPISLELGRLLEEQGAIVVYTRNDDRYVSYFDRVAIANMVNAEIFISVHANSYEGTAARGVETLYNPLYLENFRLAQVVQSELVNHLDAKNRGVRPRTDLHVLNNAEMPAVLVEVGFVSHPEEEKLLIDPDYQKKIAEGLLNGVLLFFQNYR